MSKADKRLQKIRNNPKAVSFDDLDSVLRRFGFECGVPRSGSSHHVYSRKGSPPISVPYKRPYVHEKYVKEVLAILDEITGETD